MISNCLTDRLFYPPTSVSRKLKALSPVVTINCFHQTQRRFLNEILQIDAGDFSGSEKTVLELAKKLGKLDILVVSAGIAIDGLMMRLSEEDLQKTLTVNLGGAVAAAKGALKSMMKKRTGRVVFLSSVVGEAGNGTRVPNEEAKDATKAHHEETKNTTKLLIADEEKEV